MNADLSKTIDKVLADERDVRIATREHQAEFPYGRESESSVTRREFCNFLFLTSSALLAGTAGFSAKAAYDVSRYEKFSPLLIDDADLLAPGSALNFRYPSEDDPAILVRTMDGEYHAFDQKCTHLTCPVYFAKERQRLECPCHEGGFDAATGRVLYGPPPRALPEIALEMHGREVWAVGVVKDKTHEPA